MTIKVTIVRHGQTSKNQSALIQTGMYEELTEIGIEQGKLLGQYFKNNEDFDAVFTSDMTRAIQTAQAIASQWEHQDFKIISTPRLRERDYGEWDGKPIQDLINLAKELGVHPVKVTAPGGESYDEAFDRFLTFLESLLELEGHNKDHIDQRPSKHYLVIMHSALIHGFFHKLIETQKQDFLVENLDREQAFKPPPNTGFSTFTMSSRMSDTEDEERKLCFKFEKILCTNHFNENCYKTPELITY